MKRNRTIYGYEEWLESKIQEKTEFIFKLKDRYRDTPKEAYLERNNLIELVSKTRIDIDNYCWAKEMLENYKNKILEDETTKIEKGEEK